MELTDARKRIDEIDDTITRLFAERMEMAKSIAAYKAEHNLPVADATRERDIISRVAGIAGDALEGYAKVLFTTLFDVSRAYQNQILLNITDTGKKIEYAIENTPKQFPTKAVVACQGVEGAYSQLACDRLFSMPSIMYFNQFSGVFQAVEQGLCKYGLLPIENSTAGSVNEVYDLMKKHHFYIVKSIKLCIEHTLLAKKGVRLSDIKEIYSHEQAIDQCGEFLKNLKGVKVTVCENTAAAAQLVASSDRSDVAAISSRNCAELYGLSILSDSVQNSDNNYTRFICISKNLEIYPGANKISLMLSIPHRPGSLYNVIAKFSALGLNLTKLESRPYPGTNFEFMFYFDIDASIYAQSVTKLICEFENELDQFVYLGSYSEVF